MMCHRSRKNRLICLLATLLLFLPGREGYAVFNPEAYNFNYLTTDQGLSQNMVDYIYKDSRGFMWFATWNGLNCYDGYQFNYYNTQSEANAINSLFVHVLQEDRHHYLWVGTEEGLNRINLYTGDIEEEALKPFIGDPLFRDPIYSILEDSRGHIWVGSSGGLTRITLDDNGDISSIRKPQNDIGRDVTALWEDSKGRLWVGYRSGYLQWIEPGDADNFRLSRVDGTLRDAYIGEVFVLVEDEAYLWIGTYDALVRLDKATLTHRSYLHDPADPHSIMQNCVKDMLIDKNGDLLIATLLGLCSYDREKDRFFPVAQQADKGSSLNNNFVNSLYQDDNGTIWVGTEKGGINKMIPKEVMFTQYAHHDADPRSLSVGPANSIYEDSNGKLWIGTVEGGLNKRDDRTGAFVHYRHDWNDPHSLSHNTVSYITEGGGYLWVGTWGQTINRMPLNREGYFDRAEDLLSEGSFLSPLISWIHYDEVWNGLWIGSHTGLEYYDIARRTTTPVLQDMEYGKRIKEVFGLCLDRERRLWVGTGFGLYCLDLNKTNIEQGIIHAERYNILSVGTKGSVNEKINCIYESAQGDIWVGTYGYGLAHLERDADGNLFFRHYNMESGLSNNVIYSIQEGDNGDLWISTDSGLSCFSPEKKSSINFYASDGFSTNQFYWVASCRRQNGEMLFGNLDGVVAFQPKITKNNTDAGRVTITRASLYNQKVNPKLFADGWRLREKDKSFALEFSSLSYIAPEKVRYAYRLEGFSSEWTEVDANRRYAAYTNLRAGKYTFQVRCTLPDGEWSELITELPIRVIPPFYKESWFLITMAILALLLLYYFSMRRMRSLQKQNILLEKKVAKRTEEILNQNRQLQEQNDKITRQKEQLEVLSEQLRQATQDKIDFFTNIGHEFKTPITLIQGPIEQALRLSQNPKVIDQLNLVHRNSKYLLSLVNQLMDFRKAEEMALRLYKRPGNLQEFTAVLLAPFRAMMQKREITLQERYRIGPRIFRFDSDMIQRLLTNLLSNAVKYTPNKGTITLYMALFDRAAAQEQSWLYLAVNDSGCGIPDEYKEKVFDSFFQTENKVIAPVQGQSGTGIGLSLCKQIVGLLNGRIWVEDNPSGGASFRILLPLAAEDMVAEPLAEEAKQPELIEEEVEIEESLVDDDSKPRLLIVEDNADMRIYIRSILEDQYSILEASQGVSGFEKALKYLPDFIISDIMMPEMNGLEFCKKIKHNFSTSHIPVLLLTAKSSTTVRIEGYKVGADGYIAKPFDADLLRARIENILESRLRLHNEFQDNLDVRKLKMEERSPDKLFLDNLMNILRDHYQDASFDVSQLMDKMNMSKSLLHSKLQSLTGQSAVKIIRNYRLNKAKELFDSAADSAMNVSEIAYKVGFNDPKYFTRCFTKYFGIAPSQYMKK
ncbi:signal transduction histidine kinase/ligand-binding sensor domain-containing protein/CheY-like chemotaxis protein [Parabacteroides sp. PFB2-12]|nr:signal transduction histidine kinase/ligand-binding sensor domain-containing protein/CheY-like chemotaxis protein [Parabacteroides sp. PFB2-12]